MVGRTVPVVLAEKRLGCRRDRPSESAHCLPLAMTFHVLCFI
jgi:hypothetical protein